jgi:putative flippase GtrA
MLGWVRLAATGSSRRGDVAADPEEAVDMRGTAGASSTAMDRQSPPPRTAAPDLSGERQDGSASPSVGRDRARDLGREASGFAAAGALGLAVDIGGYNALVFLGEDGLLDQQPLVAKTISLVAGTAVAYFGNRFWTYRHRPRGRFAREFTLYMALSGVALGIALACLAFSRYVLGLTGPMADNISANGVGLALGSLFRFLSYRRFVFRAEAPT